MIPFPSQEAQPNVRKMGEKIDNLTAQLLVAEESAIEKENEITALKTKVTTQVDMQQTIHALQEKVHSLEAEVDTMPVLQAQVCLSLCHFYFVS